MKFLVTRLNTSIFVEQSRVLIHRSLTNVQSYPQLTNFVKATSCGAWNVDPLPVLWSFFCQIPLLTPQCQGCEAKKVWSIVSIIIMPPPRGHNAVIGVRRPSVRLSVRLISRTSALTRKPKGLGWRNFAQGYPRSHATPTPTSRSKGQKSRSRGGGILWRPPSRTACLSHRSSIVAAVVLLWKLRSWF